MRTYVSSIRIYIHVYICVRIYVHTSTWVHTRTCIRAQGQRPPPPPRGGVGFLGCSPPLRRAEMHVYAYMSSYACFCIHMLAHVCTCRRMYTYVCTCMH